jgi:fucose 4-O-acetylase-like acetyltransferase
MNKKLSLKISSLSFFLMLIVVLIHARTIEFDVESKGVVWFTQYYLNNLYEVAVPSFFFISGYLFFLSFRNKSKIELSDFKDKLVKRLRTLLLPYVLWCIFWFLVMCFIQSIPQFQSYFSSPLYEMNLKDLLYKLFWEPLNYPFWFLRELILYTLLSPLLYLLLKYLKVYGLLLCFIASIFLPYVLIVDNFYIVKYFSLFFFLLGSYFSLFSLKLTFNIKTEVVIFMLLIWMSLAVLELYIRAFMEVESWVITLINHLMILLGCISCWLLYDVLDKKYDFQYKNIYAYGFFLYATHGILITLLIKAVLSFFELTRFGYLVLYGLSFLLVTSLCIGLGYIFKKIAPKLYFLSTGNR